MNKRITTEQKEEVKRLYDSGKGLSIIEIVERTGLNYHVVYTQTKLRNTLRQRTNPETGQPFTSKGEYESYQARQRTNPETGQPFTSQTEYLEFRTRQRTNPETGQPFTSLTELKDYQARKARRRKVNRKLEELVSVSLNVLNKDLSWLAKEIGVSRQMTSLYSQGKSIPKPEILSKLFVALDTPFKTLDDLVNEDL